MAIVTAIAGGAIGLGLSLVLVHDHYGREGVLYGLLFFPFVLVYFPLYALLIYETWSLFLLTYGSIGLSWLLLSIADAGDQPPRLAIEEPPTKPVVTKESHLFTILLLLAGGLLVAALVSNLART
jgi:hypothetical protein